MVPLISLHRRTVGRGVALASCVALGGSLLVAASPPSAFGAGAAEQLVVDFSTSTGAVHGGATGVLYGLSDDEVPTTAVVAGAAPRTVTQMPEGGLQHPNGGALSVSDTFFASGGQDIYINIQDYYPKWGYANAEDPANTYPGQADFLAKVRTVVERVAREADPDELDRYVFTPFNEPDWIWYGNWGAQRERFFADWEAAYHLIHEIIPEARIAGLGEANYNRQRLTDFMTWAAERDVLPDIMTWHELDKQDLAAFSGNLAHFRALEKSLGLPEMPVNVTEYSPWRSDTGVPGRMIRWISLFETHKVDAEMAYWTAAGNLSDHTSRTQGGNGAWWLLKWYGDLTGETVEATPPRPETPDTLQALAALDERVRKGTVLLGGTDHPVTVDVEGLAPSVFGKEVDVRLERTRFTGQEGLGGLPQTISAERVRVSAGGTLEIDVPAGTEMDAYRVTITPSASGPAPTADAAWSQTTEAEAMRLAGGARAATQSGTYATSGGQDVRGLTTPAGRLSWDVGVPAAGTYRLDVLYGTGANVPGQARSRTSGRHALYVGDRLDQVVQYSSTLGDTYKGRASVLVELPAGTSTLSLRTSADGGATALPGSNVAIDVVDLVAVDGPETSAYPASAARTTGQVKVLPSDGGRLHLSPGARAEFFVVAEEDGYYELQVDTGSAGGGGAYGLAVDERPIEGATSRPGREGRTTATVHLGRGIHQVHVTAQGRLGIDGLRLVRDVASDVHATTVQAEDSSVQRSSGATVETPPTAAGSNVQGQYVGWLTAGRTITVPRPEGTRPGAYDIGVTYANADKFTGHPYNADIISRTAEIREEGAEAASTVAYQHTYSDYNFWTRTTPLTLTTQDGDIVIGNPDGDAPNIDAVTIAPFVIDVSNEGR
ncbi:hypothetical protein [Puerhibacterium sp. TATVAM-FAB25]|uniref:hypothetical protein n=1 Tax=Puerhibacterium sp. TATVAM-FAB25 TaxID=3093699 RepID=UPI00397CC151